ncbi:hypothetical protein GCM10027570_09120 [Streptomonospora sediminis]
MPSTQWTEYVDAPFDRVIGLLHDKVENPRKYVPPVRFSRILERTDDHVLREMYQPYPGDLTIRERITEREVAGGTDVVFEYVDNPTYVGAFHNTVVRAGRGTEVTYFMDWKPRAGVADPISDEVAQNMVRAGVSHLKRLVETPAQVPDWVRSFFAAAESRGTDGIAELVSAGVRFRIGSDAEAVGREGIVQASEPLRSVVAEVRHEFVHVDELNGGTRAYTDLFADFTLHDGRRVLLPFLVRLDRDTDGRITAILVNGDISPLNSGWQPA